MDVNLYVQLIVKKSLKHCVCKARLGKQKRFQVTMKLMQKQVPSVVIVLAFVQLARRFPLVSANLFWSCHLHNVVN